MYFSPQTTAILLAYLSSSATAFPLEDRAVAKHTDCIVNVQKGIAPVCWDKLGMPTYITEFQKTAIAGRGSQLFRGCQAKEPWSTCFMRDTSDIPGGDCSKVNATNCPTPKVPASSKAGKLLPAQSYYGLYNIWSIQQYIKAWFAAISVISGKNPTVITSAAQPAPVGDLTETPPADSVDDALFNLILKAGSNDQTVALTRILSETPSTATFTSPINVAVLASQLQQRLGETLAAVETNATLFLDMASKGVFSTSDVTQSVDLVTGFTQHVARFTSTAEAGEQSNQVILMSLNLPYAGVVQALLNQG